MNGSSRPISVVEPAPALGLPRGLPRGGVVAGLTTAAVAVTGAAALGLTAWSLGWPLAHDAPLMHYIAARLLQGAAPYRDLFDMNFPGVYLVHAAGLLVFGPGDAGFRALDLVLLAGILGGLAATLAPFGRTAALAGVVLFWLYHVAGGAWRAGQRDFILCLPLAWATAAILADLRRPGDRWLALAGLALGAAVWLKPHAVVLTPLAFALAARRPSSARARAFGVAAVSLALPAALVLAWLAAAGSLAAFADIVGGYLVPLYSGLGREPLVEAIRGHDLGVWVIGALGAFALAGLVALGVAGWRDGRTAALGAGLVYGVLHYVGQGKGWEYHLYPFALFAITVGAAGLGAARPGPGPVASRRPVDGLRPVGSSPILGVCGTRLRSATPCVLWTAFGLWGLLGPRPGPIGGDASTGPSEVSLGRRVLAGVLLGALVVSATALAVKGARNLDPDWLRAKTARAHAVADALRPLLAGGGTVQVFDTTDGGVHALYLTGARQPTRFLYDFHFYHDVSHPYVQRLRAELLAGLRRRPPAAAVLFERGWPHGDYLRLAAFPELADWLAAGYRLAREGDGFRVYAAVGPPGGEAARP